jgi:hypothetical protein
MQYLETVFSFYKCFKETAPLEIRIIKTNNIDVIKIIFFPVS